MTHRLRRPAADNPPFPRPDLALAERLFDELGQRTAAVEGVTRASYGAGENLAHQIAAREARRIGMAVETDAALNLYMTLPGRTRSPRLIIGSHLDSVPCGGNFDGAAGVLAGLAVAAGVAGAGVELKRDLTVMAIRAEESTWFNASYVGSRAAFGLLKPRELDQVVRADDGMTLAAHIAAAGGDVAALRSGRAFLSRETVAAFVEPHIEQGPELIDRSRSIGVVTGIRGSFRHRQAVCLGSYAHSGATPRRLRRDAVMATAALAGALDRLWLRRMKAGDDLAITIGQFATDPREHAFSKVAGRVDFALDIRSQATETLAAIRRDLARIARRVEQSHGTTFRFGPLTDSAPAPMDADIVAGLRDAAAAAGHDAPLLPSGAGHDAAVFAAQGVPTGMLFIRNANGSHNPAEAMAMEDFSIAAQTLMRFCLDRCGAAHAG
ncbi:MAG: hydantoinase/carbamoylase family amidase [Methylobacterium sp.]|nr:hydantoinase/carbamoylase family amidase [Methylobacterium sp.]MCA3606554.1 hydantoinase/carbamoylase family amidase [Methylobacterium sp.]MCA3610553.1 hydantoinase/carbamoylase family amidase [Methylobacterium sp.]MCA3619036.1 hydantoinase/carbamoylase family amidase [Methylobacterium sp.]MCA3619804.1 hydantoinase/carbamoylase family amidase [Methylobacterium sp.]